MPGTRVPSAARARVAALLPAAPVSAVVLPCAPPHAVKAVRRVPRAAAAAAASGAPIFRIAPFCTAPRKTVCFRPRCDANLSRFAAAVRGSPHPLTRATGTSVVMQIQDLPYPDPGVPDARSGPRFLWWLGRNQLGGQFKSLAWGLLHFASVSALPFCVGMAIQAVVERSGTGLALAGALLALAGLGTA